MEIQKRVAAIHDISCVGKCSLTVALPIISAAGVETSVIPTAVLSTHTGGFTGFTYRDLTDDLKPITHHWKSLGLKFDAIYTGYIGDVRQFDYILECKEKLLKKDGLFIVDPAMADYGKLYPALNEDIVEGMKRICSVADYIIPNITEACFLTNNTYLEKYNQEYIYNLVKDLKKVGAKNVILTGVGYTETELGAIFSNDLEYVEYFGIKQPISYHGTGDIFSSLIVANIMNKNSIYNSLKDSVDFIIDCIKETSKDNKHSYGVKFEKILYNRVKR